MKVIIIVRILWTAGAPRIAIEEARELQRLGHEVRLVFLRGSSFSGYDDLLDGVNCDVLSKNGKGTLSPFYDTVTRLFAPDRGSESRVDFNLIRAVPNHLKNQGVDVLICHDQFAGLAGYYTRRRLGIPYQVLLHEHVPRYGVPIIGKVASSYERKVLENAAKIFAVTEKVASSYRSTYKVDCHVNLPGFDHRMSTPFDKKDEALLAVAMWDGWRKPEVYLDIAAALPSFRMRMAGNWRKPEIRSRFLKSVEDRHLSDRVTLHEGLSEHALIDLYQLSKFCLRFGFNEDGLGMSVAESIQNSVPVVVNRDLGSAEIVASSGCGLVLDQGGIALKRFDVEPIVDFVQKSNNRVEYEKLQMRTNEVSKKFTWARHVQMFVS